MWYKLIEIYTYCYGMLEEGIIDFVQGNWKGPQQNVMFELTK